MQIERFIRVLESVEVDAEITSADLYKYDNDKQDDGSDLDTEEYP